MATPIEETTVYLQRNTRFCFNIYKWNTRTAHAT